MMHAPARTAPCTPTPGLIASLGTHTWLDQTAAGDVFGVLLITYRAPQFDDADPALVEQQMRGLVAAAGARLPDEPPQADGSWVRRVGTDVLVHFAHCTTALRVRQPRLARVFANLGGVLLVIGLDELSPIACRAEIDDYLERGRGASRLFATIAGIVDGPVPAPLGGAR
ncbi:hypothetical protein ACFVJK_42880 [Streptomyces sp. NPDC127172]|uniref:hypothetical protein n=1 Tax=Streptomyces sp. NPDC127172 TaxID=3345382 RepID=UPI00362B7831